MDAMRTNLRADRVKAFAVESTAVVDLAAGTRVCGEPSAPRFTGGLVGPDVALNRHPQPSGVVGIEPGSRC